MEDEAAMKDTYTAPYSAEEAADMLAISSEHRLRSENLAFDFDVWYPPLAQFTFPSEVHAAPVPAAAAVPISAGPAAASPPRVVYCSCTR